MNQESNDYSFELFTWKCINYDLIWRQHGFGNFQVYNMDRFVTSQDPKRLTSELLINTIYL